jgi:hypothetical protein
MNTIIEAFFLFIYLIIIFYFHFPNITNNNYLFHKIIIFILAFVFKFSIELGKKIKKSEKVDPIEILKDSSNYALYNILGYSIYIVMMYMNIPYENLYININNDNQRYLIASTIMTFCVTSIISIKKLFTG